MCKNYLYKILKGPEYNRWGTVEDFKNGIAIRLECNTCFNCRIKRSLKWQTRLILQAEQTKLNNGFMYFVTLTYNNENLFKSDTVKGYLYEVQKMVKRIRFKNKNLNLKYFFVTEFGEHTGRIHYHGVLFSNKDFLAKQPGGRNIYGHYYYQNKNLCWNNGIYSIAQVSLSDLDFYKVAFAVKYVLKYLVKNSSSYCYSKNIGLDRINSLTNEEGNLFVYKGNILKHPHYKNLLNNNEKLYLSFSKSVKASNFIEDLRPVKEWIS